MNFSNKCLRTTILAVTACAITAPAYAASSGWINANELVSFNNHVLKDGSLNIPTGIACKNNDAVPGMDRRNTMVKIEYQPNPKHEAWKWAWGANVVKTGIDLTKKGYKLVSEDSFRRKSGLLIRCAIWNKK